MKKLRHGDPRVLRLVSEERSRGYPDWPGSYVGIEYCRFGFFWKEMNAVQGGINSYFRELRFHSLKKTKYNTSGTFRKLLKKYIII